MKFEELLKTRYNSLYRIHNKTSKILNSNRSRFKQTDETIELLNLFLEDTVKIENIRNANTSFITDMLIKYNYLDDNKIEEDLKVIKVLLKGIYDNNLKISLSQEQKDIVDFYIDCVNKLVAELNEKKSKIIEEYNSINEEFNILEDMVLRIGILIEKITDKEDESILTMEDLETVKLISEDENISPDIRKNILIKFIEYNNDRKNGISKVNKVEINEVISCFKEYGKDISYIIKKYNDEVISYANIKNIKKILEYMNSVNIINRFNNSDLLAICLYGSYDSVKETYEDINKIEDNSIYFSVASVWVDNIEKKKTKKKKYKGKEQKERIKKSLNVVAHMISKEEINKNIEYLSSEGFIFDQNDIGARKALTIDNYRLREAVNALKMYDIVNEKNISDFKIWILSEPQLIEKIDRFVEIGLLHGIGSYEEYNEYLLRYPSKIHNIDYPIYMLLYKLKQTHPSDSYYETIASNRKGQLAGNLTIRNSGSLFDSQTKIENFKIENFVDYNNVITNYEKYEDLIDNNYETEINKDIFKLNEVESLEQNNRVDNNPYVYVFDGIVISRLKVLRNYSLINDGTKDSLLAAIVNGSFLTEESFEKIKRSINHILGGNDGVSKTL